MPSPVLSTVRTVLFSKASPLNSSVFFDSIIFWVDYFYQKQILYP